MKPFHISFNGILVVMADDEAHARKIAHKSISRMDPGIMNACWGVTTPDQTLLGVSCKTTWPDGSVSDDVPFPRGHNSEGLKSLVVTA